jgi:hypothetical protein
MLGPYIAVILLPEESAVRVEMNTGANGHCTIWGDPDALFDLVVEVLSV